MLISKALRWPMFNKEITQFYLPLTPGPYSPATRHHHPLAGTHCIYRL